MTQPDRGEIFRQERHAFALRSLVEIYVHGESATSDATRTTAAHLRKSNLTILREPMRRMIAEMQGRTGQWMDQVRDTGEERILSAIEDRNERVKIKRQALVAAVEYWEAKIAQPDPAASDLMLGRQRLTHLKGQLQALTGDQS